MQHKGDVVKNVILLACFLAMNSQAMAAVKRIVAGPESTVYGIANAHGISTYALIAANNLQPPHTLYPGQVLIIPSPGEHITGQGETLQDVADYHGVNVDVLAQENGVQAVRPGQQLSLPSRDTTSMAEAFRQPTQDIQTSSLDPLPSVKPTPTKGTVPPAPLASTVSGNALPQDVAAEIAREKGIDLPPTHPVSTSQANDSSRPMLVGNLAQRNAGAPTAATSVAPPPEENVIPEPQKVAKNPEKKKETASLKKTQESKGKEKETQANTGTPEKRAEDTKLTFIWPLEGEIIAKFKPGKSDGIAIKVAEGTAVKAAAPGEVLYAGDGLSKLGNLILLKHKGGWVTAYAHNSSLSVKKGDKVKQGQVIAKSGKTGDTKTPQLHFEVRKEKQPVDPLAHLGS